MLYKPTPLFLIALCLTTPHSATAGTLANNGWNASNCGTVPVAESLDLNNPNAYNLSVEKVNIYRKKIPVYLDCVVQEANSDIQTITLSAKNTQQATQDAVKLANEKMQVDIKAADIKFGK